MDTLLAISLLLTTATQFRPGDLAVGPGEVGLAIWIVLALLHETNRMGTSLTPPLGRLLVFWALFAVAECVGTVTGFVIHDVHDTGLFLHDAMAYPLVASASLLSAAGPDARRRLEHVGRLIVATGAISFVLLLVVGFGMVDLTIMTPWFWDRFQGWSANPNQLALLSAVLAFTALHQADTAEGPGAWIFAIACMGLFIWVGRLTKADTFTFSMAAGGAVFLLIKLRLWLAADDRHLAFRPALAVVATIALPLLVASTAPFAVTAATDSEDAMMGLMKNGGKEAAQEADLRLQLWQEALDRGIESGLLGLGPGPHLPIPASIIAGRLSEPDLGVNIHPGVNGTPNFEAHNTPLDLFTQGGLLAVLSFIWIMASAFLIAFTARSAGLAALLCGLAVFGMTDLIVRQPVFWFGIALCLTASQPLTFSAAVARAMRPVHPA